MLLSVLDLREREREREHAFGLEVLTTGTNKEGIKSYASSWATLYTCNNNAMHFLDLFRW